MLQDKVRDGVADLARSPALIEEASRADLVVSGDDDLRALAMFESIPIVGAAETLARLGA